MKDIKNYILKLEEKDLEQLVEDYFNVMDGVYHEGNSTSPTEEEINRRDNLNKKYGNFY